MLSASSRVQVSEALQMIEDLLADDDTVGTRTTLLSADIVSLTKLCLTTTYFGLEATSTSKLKVL